MPDTRVACRECQRVTLSHSNSAEAIRLMGKCEKCLTELEWRNYFKKLRFAKVLASTAQ